MNSSAEKILDTMKHSTFIVAEIGKNFIQSEQEQSVDVYLQKAKELVKAAKECGADAVKFQTHTVEDEVLNKDFESPHFKGKSRYAWVKRNEDSTPVDTFWKPLKAYCDEIGIVFFSTPMSRGSAVKLMEVGQPVWKIASSDVLDFVLLDFLAMTKKPIFVPIGMSTMEEIKQCMHFLQEREAPFILMHAISTYPYPEENSNLLTIEFFKKQFPNIQIGFSQNSPHVNAAIAASALGIAVLEQHFTLDRNFFGPDHKVSMTPEEFARMVQGIRAVEASEDERKKVLEQSQAYMGTEEKLLQESEASFRPLFRKGLVASVDIAQGTQITPSMLFALRPQSLIGGLGSENYADILGKKLKKSLKKFDPITLDLFEDNK